MESHGSKNFKTILVPQITFEFFQTFPEFSSQWSSVLLFWVFEILRFFGIFFENYKFTIVYPMEKLKAER